MAPQDTAAQPSAPADQRAEGDDSTRLAADICVPDPPKQTLRRHRQRPKALVLIAAVIGWLDELRRALL